MQPIRYGIIGCAGIGTTHAEAVERTDGADLVACADLDANVAREFADEYDVTSWYDDVTEMIEESAVDAVSVCTPSGTHADVTIEAAEAGSHVLCEKPLDVYADRMNRMIDACEEADVTLAGVFQRRFQPASKRAKAAVDAGELGELVLGDAAIKWFRSQEYYDSSDWRGTRDMDGGVMLNQAVHSIDHLQWLVGDVETVRAVTDTIGRDIECETVAALALRFENGAAGTVSATTATKAGRDRTVLNGTEGSLALTGAEIDYIETELDAESYGAETESRGVNAEPLEWGEGHVAVVQDFVDALRERREPAVPGSEARKVVDLILAAYASSARNEGVSVADVRNGRIPEALSDAVKPTVN